MYTHMLSNDIFFIFDLETNGLPYSSSRGYKFVGNWPKIVQIAWGLYNYKGENLVFRNYTLKPINFVISQVSKNCIVIISIYINNRLKFIG